MWIDVLRLVGEIIAAFEVEHTRLIYSGIVRMLDLALDCQASALHSFFLVAPTNAKGMCARR